MLLPPLPPPFQVTAQRTFDWVLSQKLKALQKVAEEEDRQNARRWGEDLVVDCLNQRCRRLPNFGRKWHQK